MMSADPTSNWLSWFEGLETDESIRTLAYAPCRKITGLSSMPPEQAAKALEDAWKEVFVPGRDHLDLLGRLLQIAKAFAEVQIPTLNAYNRLRSATPAEEAPSESLICLSGLAGVSKSSLIKALQRVLQPANGPSFAAAGQVLSIHPVTLATISGKPSVASILKSLSNPVIASSNTVYSLPFLKTHLRDWFGATATCMLAVDEMQFFTQSSTASTQTSQLIMTFANLGVPMVYVANYSLVNKLKKRAHEETDRLLARPMVLNPPTVEDPVWRDVIDELMTVSPSIFLLDSSRDGEELHRYTGGLYRLLRVLLVAAYRDVRDQGRFDVTMQDVRRAYRSRSFSIYRRNVEALASLAVSRTMEESRPDLVCPFEDLDPPAWRRPAPPPRTAATQASPPAVSAPEALIQSTLSVAARAALKQLRDSAVAAEDSVPAPTPKAKRARTVPVTAEALLRGDQLLRSTSPKARRPVPQGPAEGASHEQPN